MKKLLPVVIIFAFLYSCKEINPPQTYGPVPSPKQMEWQKLEYYMFVHFGPNTFTNVEWGNGKEDPAVFNPTNLDCRQWAETAKNAGMKGIIITAKHHDGFCLWPSQYSTHTVRESNWKEGKGDVLKELSEACKEYGLKFGVYLSPWDQNHPAYGTPEYNTVFANTLTEVLTGYGDVFEQWFDGANGDALRGKSQEYDWKLFNETVYKYQPNSCIFSDVGPDCRWMGNEKGIAGETNWSRLNMRGFEPGLKAPREEILNQGEPDGEFWIPAETDVSIRPGWFYSSDTDEKVKSADELMDIYYTSVGRNSNLLLNVPPTPEGRIHPTDSARLMEFRIKREEAFTRNFMKEAKIKASNTRGNSKIFGVQNLQDDNYDSYWTVDDEILTPSIEFSFKENQTINCLMIQEFIPLGQRIARFSLESWNEDTKDWKLVISGTTIGYKRMLKFPEISTKKLRLKIDESRACPVITSIKFF